MGIFIKNSCEMLLLAIMARRLLMQVSSVIFLFFLKFPLLESCEGGRAGSFYTYMHDSVFCKTDLRQLVSGRMDGMFQH